MNSLGLILLLSTLSSLFAAFAQNCPQKFTPLLPRNSDFNKACSANSASKSPCFHHVSGSLRSASVAPKSSYTDPTQDVNATLIVKDGFLTDFTIADITSVYYVAYLEAGIGLLYMPGNSDNCYFLTWTIFNERSLT
ncbi:related to Mig1 protein [Ustilago bromivora]|uniref:Related to Mig1 protein n=1 Tax=Ustilago bromivora TaxID=307758 RepID=A0A1K0G632_9BASI|nr:related to Mig1 protein [Ustilago bromivora]